MSKQDIDQFLAERQIGIAGVSRKPEKFSNKVCEKLKECGCEIHPVHPEMESLDSDKCVRGIRQLPAEVRSLMIVASPDVCAQVLAEVAETPISRVWVFSGPGAQAGVNSEIERLKSSGVSVISGLCPFMFLEPVGSVHAFHRFFVRLFGRYPK